MKISWKRPFTSPAPEAPRPMKITAKLIAEMLPTFARLNSHKRKLRKQGKTPFFSVMKPYPVKGEMGVPLGGMGGGSITRGWQGDFNRWQMHPGQYVYGTVNADQFSLRVKRKGEEAQALVLNPRVPDPPYLKAWQWGLDPAGATYNALFPRAWTTYANPLPGIHLSCRQVSPFIPGNYQESSYPASVFVWEVENTADSSAEVSLMFTFQNGIGSPNDLAGGHTNHLVRQSHKKNEIIEIDLHHTLRMPKPFAPGKKPATLEYWEDELTLAIAAQSNADSEGSYRTRFMTSAIGMDIWADFATDGVLDNDEDDRPAPVGSTIGAGVCLKVQLKAGQKRELTFALAWDMPVARFGDGAAWLRRYTRFMGADGNAAPKLILEALTQHPKWEKAIEKWQKPILKDVKLLDWYKAMLFNETYYLVDGGTIWTAGRADGVSTANGPIPEPEMGHFAYLESHDYRMYNTYDVHFYASFALARLFPELELSLQRDFANAVLMEHPQEVRWFLSGSKSARKRRGAVPHDMGAPTEEPWTMVNAYNAQDVSRWKDLNPKFVLQVWRDYRWTHDMSFLREVFPAVKEALAYMQQFDRDGDGMIENEGFPDQTYDVWKASGPSVYSGGLWLASLQAGAAMARKMEDKALAKQYLKTFEQGQSVYERLWNGSYYDYDASTSHVHDSIMADQLAGHWYSLACSLGGIVPIEHARKALTRIFDANVLGYEEGRLGAMNGMRPDGSIDRSCMQSQEIWTGTTYALAAAMLQENMFGEAFKTVQGIYQMVYERYGLWFQTPEALSADGSVRAASYMRPLSIWAVQDAWERGGKGG